MKSRHVGVVLALACLISIPAQGADTDSPPYPKPLRIGSISITGSMRVRGEAWDWFLRDTRARYAYGDSLLRLSIAQQRRAFDWKLELGQSTLFALPSDAVVPVTGESIGLGGDYFTANRGARNVAGLFLKQAYISVKGFGDNGTHLRVGRFDYGDGLEISPADETLAALKRDRLVYRLIGDAGWTAVGRSFDGVKLSYDRGEGNISFLAVRPTQGVYQADGLRELDVDLLYAAYTREIPAPLATSEVRLFALGYQDDRKVLKVDNRPLPERQADGRDILIGTFGGHFMSAWNTRVGKWDALLWGAIQNGRWGVQEHRAGTIDVELGWHPPHIWGKPWLRASAFRGSGDNHPEDNKHETFFQVLPTSRWYARIPFYNFQNTMDFTGQLIMELNKRLKLHSQIHKVKLTEKKDLWYMGTGAFQDSSFGYEGISGNGRGGLANYIDTSLQYKATSHLDVTFYVGALSGKAVMTNRMQGRKGGYGYIELLYYF